MTGRYLRIFLLCASIIVFSACKQADKTDLDTAPAAISGDDECALDGMIVANYPGPKAQIRYRQDGKIEFFCETKELFHVYVEPGMEAKVAALYVQDTAAIDWKKPVDNWIEAQGAFYVVGASLNGSMGPTYAPFKNRADAAAFIKQYGGKTMTFNEVINLIGG